MVCSLICLARRVHIGWLHEEDNYANWIERGWSGVQSIPRVVSLGASGRLQFTPIPEFEAYRYSHTYLPSTTVTDKEIMLPASGAELDMIFVISNVGQADTFGFIIATNEQNSTEGTWITFYQSKRIYRLLY